MGKKRNETNQEKVVKFLDLMIQCLNLKNDAALCRAMECAAPVVSKLRHGILPFGATYIIRAHELTGWSIADIKAMLK